MKSTFDKISFETSFNFKAGGSLDKFADVDIKGESIFLNNCCKGPELIILMAIDLSLAIRTSGRFFAFGYIIVGCFSE